MTPFNQRLTSSFNARPLGSTPSTPLTASSSTTAPASIPLSRQLQALRDKAQQTPAPQESPHALTAQQLAHIAPRITDIQNLKLKLQHLEKLPTDLRHIPLSAWIQQLVIFRKHEKAEAIALILEARHKIPLEQQSVSLKFQYDMLERSPSMLDHIEKQNFTTAMRAIEDGKDLFQVKRDVRVVKPDHLDSLTHTYAIKQINEAFTSKQPIHIPTLLNKLQIEEGTLLAAQIMNSAGYNVQMNIETEHLEDIQKINELIERHGISLPQAQADIKKKAANKWLEKANLPEQLAKRKPLPHIYKELIKPSCQ